MPPPPSSPLAAPTEGRGASPPRPAPSPRAPADPGVEPAGAPAAPGGHPDLAAALAQPLAHLVVELGGERAGADPGGVCLEDADHRVDPGRPDARAGAGPARGRVGRGDE